MKMTTRTQIATLSKPAQKILSHWTGLDALLKGDSEAQKELESDIVYWLAKCEARQNKGISDVSLQEGVSEALAFVKSQVKINRMYGSPAFKRDVDAVGLSIAALSMLLQDTRILEEAVPEKLYNSEAEDLIKTLMYEAYIGNVPDLKARLEIMYQRGWDPNPHDLFLITVLHMACESPTITLDQFGDVVEFLSEKGVLKAVLRTQNGMNNYPLIAALSAGDGASPLTIGKVNLLLDHGADPHAPNGYSETNFLTVLADFGGSAISWGTCTEYAALVNRVIQMGADLDQENTNGRSARQAFESSADFQAAMLQGETHASVKPTRAKSRL